MFHEQIATITPDWPSWVFITIYLAIGFCIGIIGIIDGESESPVGVLIMATFVGPIVVLVLAPFALTYGIFTAVVWLLGIEPKQSDTHGV